MLANSIWEPARLLPSLLMDAKTSSTFGRESWCASGRKTPPLAKRASFWLTRFFSRRCTLSRDRNSACLSDFRAATVRGLPHCTERCLPTRAVGLEPFGLARASTRVECFLIRAFGSFCAALCPWLLKLMLCSWARAIH